MYHIKEDKRVKKSAELICSGLLECLKTKDFSDVTVTDVLNASTVGRATFCYNNNWSYKSLASSKGLHALVI